SLCFCFLVRACPWYFELSPLCSWLVTARHPKACYVDSCQMLPRLCCWPAVRRRHHVLDLPFGPKTSALVSVNVARPYALLSLKLLGYLPAFSLFGFLDGADAAASSSAALPTFCRASVACRTSDRLFNLFAAPERGLCFFPSPVGG